MLVIIRSLLFSDPCVPSASVAVEFSDNKINSELLCHRAQVVRNLQLKLGQLKFFRSFTAVYLIFQRAIGNWFYMWMLSISFKLEF